MWKQGVVCPHDLLDGLHSHLRSNEHYISDYELISAAHLPDPLPELGAVPGAAHPQQQVPELRHLQVQLQQRLAPADIDIMTRCR